MLCIACGVTNAHSPAEFLLVTKVQPGNAIEHGLELQDRFDAARVMTDLRGPRFHAVGCNAVDSKASPSVAFLTGYEVAMEPRNAELTALDVMDTVRGAVETEIQVDIANPQLVFLPAQRLGSGTPKEVPHGLDHYKAYSIESPKSVSETISIQADGATSQWQLLRPLYLCIATKKWHHGDFDDATHPSACFVIYEASSTVKAASQGQAAVATLDELGLNRLETVSTTWVAARAALFSSQDLK